MPITDDLFASEPITLVDVQLPLALDKSYAYSVPEGMSLSAGDFVLVPLGQRKEIGVIWDHETGHPSKAKPFDKSKLKAVLAKLDVPPLPEVSRKFVSWVARYNLMPIGMVLKMVMSTPQAFEPAKPRYGVRWTYQAPDRRTQGRDKVLQVLKDDKIWLKKELADAAAVGTGVIDGLVKAGTLILVEIPASASAQPKPEFITPHFSDDQNQVVQILRGAVQTRSYSTTLLDGVTGAGKTEVYFEAVAQALSQGQQVLIMLPEIALTSGFISRFERRFGVKPVEWHSTVSAGARARIWRSVLSGEAKAVIGARSGLFLPFQNLGLIVVDEEHDTAFKQEDRVTYQGRDMAVVRALLGQIPIILASATPSIESYVNVRQGRYRHAQLTQRFSGYALPDLSAIDLRKHPPEKGQWLSPVLREAMKETLARTEQSLLFLNRRGYAPLTLCRACGHRFDCPQCTAWLVHHHRRHRLQCHHCGFSTPLPKKCPKCETENALVPCGPGVERVAEEVEAVFPDARVALLSSDLAPNVQALREVLRNVAEGDADIVIGTQIVAKGHNFPRLTCVGVVDGDLGLAQGGDPRAGERTFQLLQQVTGRAGRFCDYGRGFIQTYLPEHPVMQALISGDRDAFLEHEINMRHLAGLPPFGRMASLIVSSKVRDMAYEFARLLALKAPAAQTIQLLGPVEAPISVIRGRHRFRLLLKSARDTDIQEYLRVWLEGMCNPHGDVKLNIDIDPYNFL
ncbi:MAG: primosomal protein N' [Pseudomonadota bacterium]